MLISKRPLLHYFESARTVNLQRECRGRLFSFVQLPEECEDCGRAMVADTFRRYRRGLARVGDTQQQPPVSLKTANRIIAVEIKPQAHGSNRNRSQDKSWKKWFSTRYQRLERLCNVFSVYNWIKLLKRICIRQQQWTPYMQHLQWWRAYEYGLHRQMPSIYSYFVEEIASLETWAHR